MNVEPTMRVSCSFCGVEDDFQSTADALDAGWYTHTHSTGFVTFDHEEATPQSMGFACPQCVERMSDEGGDATS